MPKDRKSDIGNRQSDGYTLVELLVVMALMAIISLIAFVNLGSFKNDQSVKQSSADLITALRSLQTNSTSNVTCFGNTAKSWQGRFYKTSGEGRSIYKLDSICSYDSAAGSLLSGCSRSGSVVSCVKSTYSFDSKVIVDQIGSLACQTTKLSDGVVVNFTPLSPKAQFLFEGSPIGCKPGSQLTIDLKNSSVTDTLKTVVVDQGGSIYEQKIK